VEEKSIGRHAVRRIGRLGQTTVEYLLTTLTLVTAFAGMYGFMQGQLKKLFLGASIKILTSYHK
jgi:hypothetical protein